MTATKKKKTIVSFQVPPYLKAQMDSQANPYTHKQGYSAIIRLALEEYFSKQS